MENSVKIRLSSNSIRYRVSASELASLSENASLQEVIATTPGKSWTFEIRMNPEGETMSFIHDEDSARVSLPNAWLSPWKMGKKIGYEMKLERGPDLAAFRVLVERDLE
jgi:hypothetical protein